MTVVADYELQSNGETAPEPAPSPACRPQPTSLTVTVRRVVQPRAYESCEITLSLTVDPDPHYSAGDNFQRVFDLLSARVQDYADELLVDAQIPTPS